MAILGFFLKAIATVLDVVLNIVLFLVIGRAILSWVSPDPSNPIVRFLNDSTEPFLRPLRRFIPLVGPGIDLTPIILLLIIYFLRVFLVGLLMHYSMNLGIAEVPLY